MSDRLLANVLQRCSRSCQGLEAETLKAEASKFTSAIGVNCS